MQNKNVHFASNQLDDLTLGLQQAKNLYCLDIEPGSYNKKKHQLGVRKWIKRKKQARDDTFVSYFGGCHCALSPPGPKIECLERVSSFGRKFTDLGKSCS